MNFRSSPDFGRLHPGLRVLALIFLVLFVGRLSASTLTVTPTPTPTPEPEATATPAYSIRGGDKVAIQWRGASPYFPYNSYSGDVVGSAGGQTTVYIALGGVGHWTDSFPNTMIANDSRRLNRSLPTRTPTPAPTPTPSPTVTR